MRGRALVWGVVLGAAFIASGGAEARPKPPEEAPRRCRSLGEGRAGVNAAWGRPARTHGCFFFSGPYELGRDDHLGNGAQYRRSGDRVVVRFGDLIFSGRVNGDRVQLRRESGHEFGSAWTVTEVIDARFITSNGCTVLRGTYRYEECDSSRPESCPGTCTIVAPVTFAAR